VGDPPEAARNALQSYISRLRGEVARLEELRLAAVVERVAAELALGRYDQVVGELEVLVGEQPLRERCGDPAGAGQ
jgi:Bacterial transcriptional activator domain